MRSSRDLSVSHAIGQLHDKGIMHHFNLYDMTVDIDEAEIF